MNKPYTLHLKGGLAKVLGQEESQALAEVLKGDGLASKAQTDILLSNSSETIKLVGIRMAQRFNIPIEIVSEVVDNLKTKGVLWDHMADALAQKGVWNKDIKTAVPIETWIEQLSSWVRSAPVSEVVEMYQSFGYLGLRQFLAEKMNLEKATLEEILPISTGEAIPTGWLLKNSTVSSELSAQLLVECFSKNTVRKMLPELVEMVTQKFGSIEPKALGSIIDYLADDAEKEKKRGQSSYSSYNTQRYAQENLSSLIKIWSEADNLPEEILIKLFKVTPTHRRKKAAFLFHNNVSESERKSLLEALPPDELNTVLWSAVYKVPTLSTEHLLSLAVPTLSDDRLIALMKHPNANMDIWKLARGRDSKDMRMAIAQTPLASEPDIRSGLLGSSRIEIMSGLLKSATAEEWPAIFYRLMRKDYIAGLNQLASLTLPEGTQIPAGWIKEHMLSSDPKTRELAVICLSKCQGGYQGASAPPPERAPRLKRTPKI